MSTPQRLPRVVPAPAKVAREGLLDAGNELFQVAALIRTVSCAISEGDAELGLVALANQVDRLGERVLLLTARRSA